MSYSPTEYTLNSKGLGIEPRDKPVDTDLLKVVHCYDLL